MKCYVISFTLFITICGFYIEDSSQIPVLSSCPEVKILNGRARPRSRGRMIKFSCFPGFELIGNKYAACTGGRLDIAPPICVNSMCPDIGTRENLVVAKKNNGAILLFVCHPGYELQGPTEIYCNGRTWNDTVPTCKTTRTVTPTSCDFEKPDICMWEQDPLHDFDWKRHNFDTPSWRIGTGPSHDHTLGPGYDGYYLYIEATDKPENATARIISPLYSGNLTEAGCFSFWYHMYGATIGTLNVYYKAEGNPDQKLMFTESGNQGNQWWKGFFNLPRERKNFQLIIEGIRGSGYVSDIAVDDVAILQGNECLREIDSPTVSAVTATDDQVEIVNGMQSCRGRCNETNTTNDQENLCQCDQECYVNHNCCPDFLAYCIIIPDYGTENSFPLETITMSTVEPDYYSSGPDRIPIPISPKDGIDPYPPKSPDNRDKFPSIITSTNAPKIPIITTVVPNRRPPSTVTTFSEDDVPLEKQTTEDTDNFDNHIDTQVPTKKDAQKISHERVKVTMPGIIAIVIGSLVGIAGTVLIIFLILQKRNTYKKKSGTSALSDDSDVRFLTSDEMLDFNIAKPEDMEL